MRGLSGLSDFFLRKAFKFALKRNLGKYLASEIDPSQLDVQLGQGTIELRQLLLNCNELNEQLNSPYWEITAGFIGSVKATVPITTLSTDSCQAVVDEILLTVKPRSLHHPSVHGVSASMHLSGYNLVVADLDDQSAAQDIMTDGIMQIAGGIETIVQQLQLQATRATIRVELPSVSSPAGPPSLIMIHLDSITYSGESSPPLDAAREAVNVVAGSQFESSSIGANGNRHVIICSSNGVGCSGQGSLYMRAGPKPQKANAGAGLQPSATKPEEGPLGWEVTAQCGEVSLVLWYSEEEEEDGRSDSDQDFAEPFSCDYRPRFCLETGDVMLHVTAANDAALQCDLTLHRLECAEHLPVSGQEAAPAAATLAEVTRVTELLPPSAHGARPTPSFTGVSPLPVMHSLYSSTLSQLASSHSDAGLASAVCWQGFQEKRWGHP
ncbi:hypothetical protein WJX79_000037 [Trebouxia sp. C0005]